jgi:dCMP deaminase
MGDTCGYCEHLHMTIEPNVSVCDIDEDQLGVVPSPYVRGPGDLACTKFQRVKAAQVDSRPAFPEIYMRLAKELSRRSTCKRLQVGTVITSVDYRKVYAVGYNGNASGLPNTCDRDEPGNCGCLHSEDNAVINCDAPRDAGKIVYVTHLPCVTCAKRLVNLGGVEKIYYGEDYRIRDSLELLKRCNIEVEQLRL